MPAAANVVDGSDIPGNRALDETSPKSAEWLGWFYSANIVGAVSGCVIAGFYLLRLYDIPVATYTAAAINVGVA
jgi:spermidine synthase